MSKELAKTYDPKAIEEKLYEKWCENKYFHAEVDRPLFLQGRVDRHIHRFRMVLTLTEEQPFVLVVHSCNIDLCVSLVVVTPVRANA